MYKKYFSARNIDPHINSDYKLPNWILKKMPEDTTINILDIGCGFGQVLLALKQKKYKNLKGIDICNESVSFCRQQGLNVELIDINEFFPDEKFDVIFMNHILEHIPKHQIIPTMLHLKNNLLKTDGLLFLSVPNAQSNTNCYWAYEDFTHNTLFTAGSIHFVLKSADFSQISFIDPLGIDDLPSIKRIIKFFLIKLYHFNKMFWNKVTSSYFHDPSPIIYTYEIKVLAKL